jgi:predicted permease
MWRVLRALWFRLRGLMDPERMERDFAIELESHLELHIEDGLRAGLSPDDARRQALIKLGGMEQTKISYRERRGLPFVETLGQDVSYGTRILRKNPGFAFITVLTLALGIGANATLFSIVNGVLLSPLPYPRPNELVAVHASKPNFDEGSISYPNFRDWQRDNHALAALAVSRQTTFSLTGKADAERVRGDFVSSDFFSLLGVKPLLGRVFSPGEDEIGRDPAALISAGFWARKFGSSPDVIGKAITLDGRDFTIVGVLPAAFDLSLSNFRLGEIYVPIGQWQTAALRDRGAGLGLHGIARIKPGFTLAQAQADMSIVSDHLARSFPADDHGLRAKLVPLRQSMVGSVQPLLLVLFGAVGFVLLIACANVANLLLARSNARAQEFAIRSALGAGRVRIIRQLLTESTMLSLAGGAFGLLLANWGTQAALKLVPATLPRSSEVHLNAPVLCFTLLVSLTVGILFGLLPVWKISRYEPHETLKDGGRSASGTRHHAQDLLVILEMALALVLLTGAGLTIRSMIALSAVDPGFIPQDVLTFSLSAPPSMATASSDAVRAYYREAHARMRRVPGIEGVSLSWGAFPMSGDDEQLFWLDNEPKPPNSNDMDWALDYKVEPDYLRTMRIPLLRGRFFNDTDNEHAPLVVVIDDVLARKFFGNDDPVGKHINLDGYAEKATVVGLVRHVMQYGFADDSPNPLQAEMYTPFMQLRDSEMSLKDGLGTDVVIRSRGDSAAVLSDIRQTMREMNQEQVIYGAETMNQIIAASLAARRFSMILLGIFAGLALLLASVGMYGVVSYLVCQRTQEIGVRRARGADRMDVLRWVLQQGGKLALIGAGLGLVSALALTQVMAHSSMIYGVHPYDPWTLMSVTAFLMAVALASCYIPARRAMHILPMQALRAE